MTKPDKPMKTKDRILQGAKQYLAEHGLAGFTVRSVAKEAGVNQGLVHHYFGSKENLVLELIDHVVEAPFEQVKKTALDKSTEEIRTIILKYLLQNNELINLMIEFIYLAQHSPVIREKIKQIMKVRREFFTGLLGIENEEDRYAFNAGIFGIIFVHRIDGKVDVNTAIRKLFERFQLL